MAARSHPPSPRGFGEASQGADAPRGGGPPARCLALLDRLSGYIDAELTPRQRRAIETHCRDCTRCQKVIASLRRTIAACRQTGVHIPSRTRARARARIARLLEGLP